jgi:hypothetical protein
MLVGGGCVSPFSTINVTGIVQLVKGLYKLVYFKLVCKLNQL